MKFIEIAMRRHIVKNSLLIALVVGTLLNLINQGDAMFSATSVNITKCALTYLVPYCVSTYGAVTALMTQEKGVSG